MNDGAVVHVLEHVAQKTLETMFFALPDCISGDTLRPRGELIAARMTFQGQPPGRFGILLSEPVARSIAADFLGADDEVDLDSRQIEEVVGELTNIVCGSMLSELEEGSQFDLSTPVPVRIGASDPGPDFTEDYGGVSPVSCRFEMPRGSILFHFAFGTAQ